MQTDHLSDDQRAAVQAFQDEHDQHGGYVASADGLICHGDAEHHPAESVRLEITVDEEPVDAGPTSIPISFNLDLTRYLSTWHQSADPDDDGYPGPVQLEDVLIHAAAVELAKGVDKEAMRDLTSDARRLTRTTQDTVVAEMMRERITAMLDEPMQPTDGFGRPTGEPTSLRQIVSEGIDSALKEKVTDPYGKARGSSFDAPKRTVVEWAIGWYVQSEVAKAVKAAMEEAKAEVVEAVRAEGARVLTEAVGRVVEGRRP